MATHNVLKGNYEMEVLVKEKEQDLTDQFENEALKRLGGSICFVSKKKFLFGMKNSEQDAPASEAN